jgi:hypothetical protein
MRGAGVLVVAALMVGACNGGADGRSDDTLPPTSETTVTTAPDYTVPAVIDVAYVDKVMAALDHVYGDAIRTLARERKITQDFLDRLAAIYGNRFFRLAQDSWSRELVDGLSGLRPVPGDPRTTIATLTTATRDCIVAPVVRDFSQVRTAPAPTPQRFVGLIPDVEKTPLNPTGWVLAYDGWTTSGEAPGEPCHAD